MVDLPKTIISAAIATYQRYDLLEKCIESLLAQNIPADQFKIIVIDNSPTNETANKFRQRFDGQRNIHYFLEKTPGLSNARNVAARLCNSEYIAYIDDDAIADSAWLQSILHAFEKYGPQAGIVCGKVNPTWPSAPPQWLPTSLLSALTVVDRGDTMRIAQPGEGFAGTNFSVRVKPLFDLGGFAAFLGRVGDPGVLLSNEESHLVERMRAAGYDTIWAPNALVEHLVDEQRLNQVWLRQRYAWQAVSDFIADPSAAVKDIESKWQSVLYFMQNSPPGQRMPQALFEFTDDPARFEQQTYAAYCLTTLLLAGKIQSDGEAQQAPSPSTHIGVERWHPRQLLRSILPSWRGRS